MSRFRTPRLEAVFEQSTTQLTLWSSEISELRTAKAELSGQLAREAESGEQLQRDLQAAVIKVSRLQQEGEALLARAVAAEKTAGELQAAEARGESAFGRVKDQLAIYTTRLEALQVSDWSATIRMLLS